jgi:hypothetical protein
MGKMYSLASHLVETDTDSDRQPGMRIRNSQKDAHTTRSGSSEENYVVRIRFRFCSVKKVDIVSKALDFRRMY